ncbi:S-adenosyl-L-methionine-dependent methyltransferase [Kalaharituber pfeilii]|nr:S-adenosyl-L-methionine-dependent methyltransferase [Kalaharituber pfeilii]
MGARAQALRLCSSAIGGYLRNGRMSQASRYARPRYLSTAPIPGAGQQDVKSANTDTHNGKNTDAAAETKRHDEESQKTPFNLEKVLTDAIKMNGPIPLALYMRQCLTSSEGGYYTKPHNAANEIRSPFGPKGDFVTSPEISQMFGEMAGLWLLTEWINQGRRKSGVVLMELGPGRGTLMDDVLRAFTHFKALNQAVDKIYLVEASASLRESQKNLLCGPDEPMQTIPNGYRSRSKYSGTSIEWYEDLNLVPKDPSKTPYIVAHEFFDALPIHIFQSTPNGWRELLVSHISQHSPVVQHHPSPIGTTPRAQAFSPDSNTIDPFHLTLAHGPTPHSAFLPTLSPRYSALLSRANAMKVTTTIEICPEALSTIEDLARRIGIARGGAALIIDYGPADSTPAASLRGIYKHHRVSPFARPGKVDLSADVDFLALAERACLASEDIEVHGPVEQGTFLLAMGMEERYKQLVKQLDGKDEKKADVVRTAFERLTERGGGGMGRIYKALAVVPERRGRRPVGFGGVVEGGGEQREEL